MKMERVSLIIRSQTAFVMDKKRQTGLFRLVCLFWRRERDSNPCEIALKRFSRPPRYDHFDIPPYKRNYEIVLEKTLEEKTLLSEKCVCFPQIRGFFADCFRYGKEVSRPPRYDRFDTSPYMKLSFDRNHQIFNCFRNSFRNALLCCFRGAEKVRCHKAFQGFCDRYARKFSRPPRYDHFDIPPCIKPTARSAWTIVWNQGNSENLVLPRAGTALKSGTGVRQTLREPPLQGLNRAYFLLTSFSFRSMTDFRFWYADARPLPCPVPATIDVMPISPTVDIS